MQYQRFRLPLALLSGLSVVIYSASPALAKKSSKQVIQDIRISKIQAVELDKAITKQANTAKAIIQTKAAPGPVAHTVTMDTVADGIVDLGFDGSNPWGLDGVFDEPHYIDKIDFQTGNVLSHFQAPNQSTISDGSQSLAFANSYLWVLNFLDDVIYKVDPVTGNKLSSISAIASDVASGLGFDGTYLWYGVWDYNETSGGALLNKITSSGTVIDSFRLANVKTIHDIEFVNGKLWITAKDYNDTNYFYVIDTSSKAITATYSRQPCEWGLTFDGTYLWAGDWCNYKYTAYQLSLPPSTWKAHIEILMKVALV